MSRLNQIVAVVNGQKARTREALTKLHQALQKDTNFSGISRNYQPRDDEGEQLPAEHRLPVMTAEDLISEGRIQLESLFDIVWLQDTNNCFAKGTIKCGALFIPDVPVTHLMFLEKQLIDIKTFVTKIPLLDQTVNWDHSDDGVSTSQPVDSLKTKKVPKSLTVAEATEHHPAQVQVYNEDAVVGTWTTRHLSSAVHQSRQRELLQRVETALDAVRFAREEANNMEVENSDAAGKKLLDYIFN